MPYLQIGSNDQSDNDSDDDEEEDYKDYYTIVPNLRVTNRMILRYLHQKAMEI